MTIPLKDTINVIIYAGENQGYVAECQEIAVVTQGLTLDETIKNIQEAVALHLEDEDLKELGFTEKPALKINFDELESLTPDLQVELVAKRLKEKFNL